MKSRAGYFFKQYGLVGEQLMNSPFQEDYEHKPPTTSVGYNLALHEVYEVKDVIPGGKGDETSISSLIPHEIKAGTAIETEHTGDNKQLAQEIAKDHLTEDPHYYHKLNHAGLVDEPRARRLLRRTHD